MQFELTKTNTVASARANTQSTSTVSFELNNSSSHPNQPSVEIGLLSTFIGSFVLAVILVIQYRKYRVRLHQKRILMLERLWKISPQKQV
jgi:hypothetical protein